MNSGIEVDFVSFDSTCNKMLLRICSVDRARHLVVVRSVDELTRKAQSQFSWHNQFHFVLEEDGSSISPDVMELILTGEEKIGTIMMLKDGEKWSPAGGVTGQSLNIITYTTPSSHSVSSSPLMATSGSNATVSSGSATSPLAVNSRPQLQSPVQGWATQFKIPWSCLADDFIKACSEGKRPDKPALLAAVRVVAGEIKKVTSNPCKGDLNIIANSMVAKYPKTLADFLPNIGMLGNGSTSLTFHFVRIFENMNRSGCNSLRRKLLNPTDENEETSGTARKKVATSKLVKDSYGCVSWQPDLPSGETSDSQNEKKEWLISEFLKSLEERDQVKIQQYMEKTYASQRFLLNGINKPSVIALKNHWPFLLTSDGLLAHFNRLMGFDLHSRFLEHFSTKGRLLVNYAKLNGSDAAKSVAARLEAECNFVHNSLPITFGSLQVLSHLLKEEQTLLIMYEDIADIQAVNLTAAKHPHVAYASDSIYQEKGCSVLVDQCRVCDAISLPQAVMLVFSAYYVLNIQYPSEGAKTLEFIQRAFADINPDRGSKAAGKKKKIQSVNPAVLRLLSAMAAFQV